MVSVLLSSQVATMIEKNDFSTNYNDEYEKILPIITISIFFIYYFVLELAFQQTIGKVITKTVVSNVDGSKPDIGDILGRTVLRLIPLFDAYSFLHTTKTGLHDSWSGTKLNKV